MSYARLIELKTMLENEEWEILEESGESELFSVYDDKIYWKLNHSKIGHKRELIFYLFDYIGRGTRDLDDILYVIEGNKKFKLYFDKIGSEKWKLSTKKFIKDLH